VPYKVLNGSSFLNLRPCCTETVVSPCDIEATSRLRSVIMTAYTCDVLLHTERSLPLCSVIMTAYTRDVLLHTERSLPLRSISSTLSFLSKCSIL
jgi:hypothetical protein